MNLRTLFGRYRSDARVPRARRPGEPAVAAVAAITPGGDERPVGCGWFDSSHELHAGLLVREQLGMETRATELPLLPWLELQLSGWRAEIPVGMSRKQ